MLVNFIYLESLKATGLTVHLYSESQTNFCKIIEEGKPIVDVAHILIRKL
ncbi:MAG: hypothetical protein ACLSBN_14110 [Clostridium perfringens]